MIMRYIINSSLRCWGGSWVYSSNWELGCWDSANNFVWRGQSVFGSFRSGHWSRNI